MLGMPRKIDLRFKVRFGVQTRSFDDVCSMSALPPKAAVERTSVDVAEVPKPAVSYRSKTAQLFDHLVGECEEPQRNIKPHCLGGPEIDDQLDSHDLLDRQFGRIGSFENLSGIDPDLAVGLA